MAQCPRRVEVFISLALRYGVLASSMLIAVGAVMILLSFDDGLGRSTLTSVLSHSTKGVEAFRSPSEVLQGLSRFDPNALVALGLLTLMITPIVPVVLSAASFLREQDRAFALISLAVLSILATAFFLSATGPLAAFSH